MPLQIDSHSITDTSIIPIAKSAIESAKEDLAYAYNKAMASLFNFFPSGALNCTDFTEQALRDWVACMLCNDITLPTTKNYLDTVAAIYNKAVKKGIFPPNPAFKAVKQKLAAYSPGVVPSLNDTSFHILRSLINGTKPLHGEMQLFADIFLTSFYCRGLAVSEILKLSKDDLPDLPLPVQALAARHMDPRRAKLFPRAKVDQVERKTLMLLHHIGFDTPKDATVATIAGALWMNAALRLGIPSSTVRGCAPWLSNNFALIGFTEEEKVEASRVAELSEMVIQSVTSDPSRWHVMKLRPRVSYSDLQTRLTDLQTVGTRRGASTATTTSSFPSSPAIEIETFYPVEEITLKVGKKIEKEQRPVLEDIVFFRCPDSMLAKLFRNIGDLAWGYRNTRHGSYAVVSQAEMDNFQRTIAIFTPDFDVAPLGTTKIENGQRVRVTGGQFAGREGIVATNPNVGTRRGASTTKMVTFSLRIMADNGLEWTVEIDPRLLEPIN